MINKLLPEQISNLWEIIKYAVEQSLPPIVTENEDNMNNILSSALSGKIDVWVSYEKTDKGNKLEGVMLTNFLFDEVSKRRNLLIYCLYGYNNVGFKSWIEGLQTLTKYAKSRDCGQIIAYTDVPYMIDLTRKLGGEAKYTFCSFNVKQIGQKLNELNGE